MNGGDADELSEVQITARRIPVDATGARDNRFAYYDRLIGRSGEEGDIGFHLGGDQFGFPGGGLNVVPGNSALNRTSYAKIERKIQALINENPGRRVVGRFEAVYNRGSLTNRPDSFRVRVSVSGKPRINVTLPNRAPGG